MHSEINAGTAMEIKTAMTEKIEEWKIPKNSMSAKED